MPDSDENGIVSEQPSTGVFFSDDLTHGSIAYDCAAKDAEQSNAGN